VLCSAVESEPGKCTKQNKINKKESLFTRGQSTRQQSNKTISGRPIVSKENLSGAHNRLEATDNSGTEIKHRCENHKQTMTLARDKKAGVKIPLPRAGKPKRTRTSVSTRKSNAGS
jgi:hypothetical protein